MLIKKRQFKLGYKLATVIFILNSVLLTYTILDNVNAHQTIMNTNNTTCNMTALKRSQKIIQKILDDLSETYTYTGGGGISQIKQVTTYSFVVSIPQEERVDKITYEFKIKENCEVSIAKKQVSALSR